MVRTFFQIFEWQLLKLYISILMLFKMPYKALILTSSMVHHRQTCEIYPKPLILLDTVRTTHTVIYTVYEIKRSSSFLCCSSLVGGPHHTQQQQQSTISQHILNRFVHTPAAEYSISRKILRTHHICTLLCTSPLSAAATKKQTAAECIIILYSIYIYDSAICLNPEKKGIRFPPGFSEKIFHSVLCVYQVQRHPWLSYTLLCVCRILCCCMYHQPSTQLHPGVSYIPCMSHTLLCVCVYRAQQSRRGSREGGEQKNVFCLSLFSCLLIVRL